MAARNVSHAATYSFSLFTRTNLRTTYSSGKNAAAAKSPPESPGVSDSRYGIE